MRIDFVLRDINNESIELRDNFDLNGIIRDLQDPEKQFLGLERSGENLLINKDAIIKVVWSTK